MERRGISATRKLKELPLQEELPLVAIELPLANERISATNGNSFAQMRQAVANSGGSGAVSATQVPLS